MDDFHLQEISSSDSRMLEEIGKLRVRAWVTEVPEASGLVVWLDDLDKRARHWVIHKDGRLVAAGRLSVHHTLKDLPDAECIAEGVLELLPAPIASLNRLVVDPAFRGLGLARRLHVALVRVAVELRCRSVVAVTSSGQRMIDLLQSDGFRIVGDRKQVLINGILTRPGKVFSCLLPVDGQEGPAEL